MIVWWLFVLTQSHRRLHWSKCKHQLWQQVKKILRPFVVHCKIHWTQLQIRTSELSLEILVQSWLRCTGMGSLGHMVGKVWWKRYETQVRMFPSVLMITCCDMIWKYHHSVTSLLHGWLTDNECAALKLRWQFFALKPLCQIPLSTWIIKKEKFWMKQITFKP